eukprot:COSAG02_NODE_2652_length_8323_cov_32.383268_2_plen_398_part_00
MCQALWKHTPPETNTSQQDFIAELQENGFTWDHLHCLQESHNWDRHDWHTGLAERFVPATDIICKAIQKLLAEEDEDACRAKLLKYLDLDGNKELQLAEMQELVQLSGGGVLDEATYKHMVQAATADPEREVLTLEEFERSLTEFQELDWVGSSVEIYSKLVEQGKLQPDNLELNAEKFDSELSPEEMVTAWIDEDKDGRLGREELNKLLEACRHRITNDDWRMMCKRGGADMKIGFNQEQFLRLQHSTFSFSHSWLPSSVELYEAIMELHGEVALHPEPDAVARDHAHHHLKEAMSGAPFGGSLNRVMLDKVFRLLDRSALTDDEYGRLFEQVSCSVYRSLRHLQQIFSLLTRVHNCSALLLDASGADTPIQRHMVLLRDDCHRRRPQGVGSLSAG